MFCLLIITVCLAGRRLEVEDGRMVANLMASHQTHQRAVTYSNEI